MKIWKSWTSSEEKLLLEVYSPECKDKNKILKAFPGRSMSSIFNKYKALSKKISSQEKSSKNKDELLKKFEYLAIEQAINRIYAAEEQKNQQSEDFSSFIDSMKEIIGRLSQAMEIQSKIIEKQSRDIDRQGELISKAIQTIDKLSEQL